MDERKYIYRRPRRSSEHLEAIYEELSHVTRSRGVSNIETLKDYVVKIRDTIQQVELEKELKIDREEARFSYVQIVLFSIFFALFLLYISKPGDWAWLDANRIKLHLWGIAVASIFVGISIERSTFFKTLWSFGFTKLIASIGMSALLIFCTGNQLC